MNNWKIRMNRILCVSLAWLMGVSTFTGTAILGAGVFGSAIFLTAPDAEAQRRTTTRARTTPRGTTTVRHSTTRGSAASPASPAGAARRTSRRVTRRHIRSLPSGYRTVTYGNYRYYHHNNIYYYPYYISGQTVYVEITVNAEGKPETPPPASEINVEVNVNN